MILSKKNILKGEIKTEMLCPNCLDSRLKQKGLRAFCENCNTKFNVTGDNQVTFQKEN